jgi:hypothetical protein
MVTTNIVKIKRKKKTLFYQSRLLIMFFPMGYANPNKLTSTTKPDNQRPIKT